MAKSGGQMNGSTEATIRLRPIPQAEVPEIVVVRAAVELGVLPNN
jgi:hypothetical protein